MQVCAIPVAIDPLLPEADLSLRHGRINWWNGHVVPVPGFDVCQAVLMSDSKSELAIDRTSLGGRFRSGFRKSGSIVLVYSCFNEWMPVVGHGGVRL